LRILKTSKRLTVAAAAKERSDLVVVADEGNKKLLTSVQENESEITVSAAFEEFVAELANAKPAVHVRLAERFNQIAEREETLDPFVLGQAS
jgi:hypothetical protein